MAELFFDIVSPTPGEEVGRVVTITVTAGDTDPSHFPRFAVRRVSVSASGPSTVATKVGSVDVAGDTSSADDHGGRRPGPGDRDRER